MEALRKFFVFIGGLIVIYLLACMAGGAIAGGWTGISTGQPMEEGMAREAGRQFALTYRPVIFVGACVLAAAIAFGSRFGGWLFALPLAFFGFVVLSKSGHSASGSGYVPGSGLQSIAFGNAASPVSVQAGQRATLLMPITVDIPNGRVTLPKGSSVTVLALHGEQAEVQWINGTRFSVAAEQLQPSR